jgi:hypothetical protein
MGQLLHGSARTTEAVCRAIQHRQASLAKLAARDDVHPKNVAKWQKRLGVREAPMGPEPLCSTVLSREGAALMVTCRKPTLRPLDVCVSAWQATRPHLTHSALHRCLRQQSISRLPEMTGDKLQQKTCKPSQSAPATSISPKYVPTKAGSPCPSPSTAPASVPSRTVPGGHQHRRSAMPVPSPRCRARQNPLRASRSRRPLHAPATGSIGLYTHLCTGLRCTRHRPSADQNQASLDQWPGRAPKPHRPRSHGQKILLSDASAPQRAPLCLLDGLQLRQATQNPARAYP